MAEEWKRAEALLEDVRKDIKTIAEGHVLLDKKISAEISGLRKEMNEQFSDIKLVIKGHSRTLAEHGRMLGEHSRMLGEHSKVLAEIKQDLNEVKLDLSEVKHDLRDHIRQPAHVAV